MTKSTPVNQLPRLNPVNVVDTNSNDRHSEVEDDINIDDVIHEQENNNNIDALQQQINYLKDQLLSQNDKGGLINDTKIETSDPAIGDASPNKNETSSVICKDNIEGLINNIKKIEFKSFIVTFLLGLSIYSVFFDNWIQGKLADTKYLTLVPYIKAFLLALFTLFFKKID